MPNAIYEYFLCEPLIDEGIKASICIGFQNYFINYFHQFRFVPLAKERTRFSKCSKNCFEWVDFIPDIENWLVYESYLGDISHEICSLIPTFLQNQIVHQPQALASHYNHSQ